MYVDFALRTARERQNSIGRKSARGFSLEVKVNIYMRAHIKVRYAYISLTFNIASQKIIPNNTSLNFNKQQDHGVSSTKQIKVIKVIQIKFFILLHRIYIFSATCLCI